MRAIVKSRSEPGLWLEDIDRPAVGPNDVLIQVTKSSICGTDLHIASWDEWAQETIAVPMAIGHEFTGTVVEVGSEVERIEIGQRVTGEGHITCGVCRNCRAGRRHFCINTVGVGVNRPGAFAEFVAIPGANAYPVPDGISDSIATLLDPLGNAVHTALEYDLVGEDVLVTGAGPIGMMVVAIARHVGARFIVATDINPYRLDIVRKMGVDRAVDTRSSDLRDVMADLGMKEGFDVGLEISGAGAALSQMLDVMNNGSYIALLGIPTKDHPIDWNDIIFKGLTLKGIYGRKLFETWYKMIAMLQTGLDVSPVITHEFPAERFEEAFEIAGSGESGKVILDWS
ncbi:MAG: L-threonine 3-dehydrogenase [Acidimicrobiia bacterium]|nr:L-threonine 3-dehydrogenase [Acidimicrobiia bacterium]MBT8249341.1 L-threonine 3-dehydrogenase [Acidimicrobiia bacterium]NNL27514.1 L-threonine 3-dehydrogenase [Acidimicrobiia bacterium]